MCGKKTYKVVKKEHLRKWSAEVFLFCVNKKFLPLQPNQTKNGYVF